MSERVIAGNILPSSIMKPRVPVTSTPRRVSGSAATGSTPQTTAIVATNNKTVRGTPNISASKALEVGDSVSIIGYSSSAIVRYFTHIFICIYVQ